MSEGSLLLLYCGQVRFASGPCAQHNKHDAQPLGELSHRRYRMERFLVLDRRMERIEGIYQISDGSRQTALRGAKAARGESVASAAKRCSNLQHDLRHQTHRELRVECSQSAWRVGSGALAAAGKAQSKRTGSGLGPGLLAKP